VLGTYRPFDTLPHAFFDAMALIVAASLLLAIAAAARTIWLRARPTGATKPGVGQSLVSSSWADSLLLLAVAMSWYTVGGGWAVHLVCYPIYVDMNAHGAQAFHAAARSAYPAVGETLRGPARHLDPLKDPISKAIADGSAALLGSDQLRRVGHRRIAGRAGLVLGQRPVRGAEPQRQRE